MSPFADRLRNLDTQSAPSQEFRVYTLQGAILSVITVITIIYLVATEWSYNFQVRFSEQVHVNATSPAGLELEFDITLRSLPCSRLNIDANDPNGQAQSLHLDRQHHVWKHKIKYEDDGKLHYVGDRSKLELGSTLLSEDILMNQLEGKLNATREREDENYCGSCYGAGEEGECCNSCDDVKRAYNLKGWVLRDLEQVEQCKEELVHVVEKGEGCNIHGKVALSSGGGNLHLAPGRALQNEAGDNSQISLFDLVLRTFEQWNVSHTIHKIRFGEEVPRNPNQLDGEERIIADSYGMYQYYFQVVPTLYKFLNGTTIQTNQYSVTEHLRHVNPGTGRGLPGVFFFYEVSPLHVIIEEEQKGWVAFFTSVCAVVGGVVTAMGILDQSLFAASQKNPQGLAR